MPIDWATSYVCLYYWETNSRKLFRINIPHEIKTNSIARSDHEEAVSSLPFKTLFALALKNLGEKSILTNKEWYS